MFTALLLDTGRILIEIGRESEHKIYVNFSFQKECLIQSMYDKSLPIYSHTINR